jgi:hypothetical protein
MFKSTAVDRVAVMTDAAYVSFTIISPTLADAEEVAAQLGAGPGEWSWVYDEDDRQIIDHRG